MKRKILALLLCSVSIMSLLVGCGNNSSTGFDTEDATYGEIDEDKVYVEDYNNSSMGDNELVERVEEDEEININENFKKLEATSDCIPQRYLLKDKIGREQNVDRILFGNTYFDINEVMNTNKYTMEVKDNILIVNNNHDTEPLKVEIVKLAEGKTEFLNTNETYYLEYVDYLATYNEIYDESDYSRESNGGFTTYKPFVEFVNRNAVLKKDISIYGNKDILQLLLDVYKMDEYTVEDNFLTNPLHTRNEYSEWYDTSASFMIPDKNDNTKNILMTIKRTDDAVWAFKVTYQADMTVDRITGKDYFSPLLVVNIAANEYQLLAQTQQ